MKQILFVMALIVLTACQPATPDPGIIQTAIAQTQAAQPSPTSAPTNTPLPTHTPAPTNTTEPEPVIYYCFVVVSGSPFPDGSVVILPDILILAPMLSNRDRTSDTATNLGIALQAMIHDPDNAWTSSDLEVASITFNNGTVDVVLQGEFFAPGDVVLIAARMQFLFTVFAEASVQTATITINGKNIANLGISHESEARPADYAYTRAEIETFMAENAYKMP